ncbi:MAG: hypothetical protein HYZ47_02865 [Simkania negevensis]|nr:hypothetical protein [Simkania negevensis]
MSSLRIPSSPIHSFSLYSSSLFQPTEADEQFKAFYDKHCVLDGAVGYKQALKLAKEGLSYFREGLGAKPKSKEEAEHQFSCLSWAIKYHAAAQGKPYTNGMAVLRPEVAERLGIKDHFEGFLHSRPSSHYKGRAPVQYGLDIERGKDNSLPVDKATILVGEIDTPIGTPGKLYEEGRFRKAVASSYFLKLETHPCHTNVKSWADFKTFLWYLPQTIMHGAHYAVKSLFSSFFLSANGLASRKEKTIPKEHKKTFKLMLQTMHGKGTKEYTKEMAKVNKYGLAYIDYYCKNLKGKRLNEKQQARVKLLPKEKVTNLLHYLHTRDNIDIRKGEEFIVDDSIVSDYLYT